MTEQPNKMAVGLGTTTAKNSLHTDYKTPKATKLANILRQVVNGNSLNRFEAQHYHAHCLHSTMSAPSSSIGGQYGA